jgi:hypothetical protein
LSWEGTETRTVTMITADKRRGQYDYLTSTICVKVKAVQCTVVFRRMFCFIVIFRVQHIQIERHTNRLISGQPKSIQKVQFKMSTSCDFLTSCHAPEICRNVSKNSVWATNWRILHFNFTHVNMVPGLYVKNRKHKEEGWHCTEVL